MILPGTATFQGVIGTTFDASLTVYNIETPLAWQEPLLWSPFTKYVEHAAVVASNGSAYKCLIENSNIYPVGDVTGHWEIIEPVNLTSYSAEMKVSKTLTLKSGGEGLTMGGAYGTIAIEIKPEKTKEMTPTSEHFSLLLTLPSGKVYEYLSGSIEWVSQ